MKILKSKTRAAEVEVDSEAIEAGATEVDRLAYELWIAGARLSSINNQLVHFLQDPRSKDARAQYRRIAKRALQWPDQPTCLMCHCTEYHACEGGCSWLFLSKENNWGICSGCFDKLAMAEGTL